MVVMSVKRLVGMLLIFLVLGLTTSSAMAASNVAPKSTQNVPQVTRCPCCSGNITRDAQVYEIKGATAYLKAVQVFNYENTRILLQQLPDMKPLLWDSKTILVNVRGKTYSVVIVPLRSELAGSNAVLVHVKYKNIDRISVVEELANGSKIVYTLKNGQVTKIGVEPLVDWGCVARCIASECAGCFVEGLPPGPCDLCCPLCVGCYYIRHPYICLACIGCVGVVGAYCIYQCR